MPESRLPKFEDWTPPWGDDPDSIDADKLAKYIHGLLSDKEKLQSKMSDAGAKVKAAEKERDDLQTQLDEANSKGGDEKVAGLQTKLTKAEADAKAAKAEALKFSVALDKGLTKVQAKRLLGDTEEELEADADELLESFGGAGAKADDDEDEEDSELVTRPRRKASTPGAGDGDGHELSQTDIEKAVSLIPRNTF